MGLHLNYCHTYRGAQSSRRWRFYATNNGYGTLTGGLGYSDPALSEKGYYQVTMNVPAGSSSQTFTATATPIGAQANDVCGPLTINNAGVKTPASTAASFNSNGSCW